LCKSEFQVWGTFELALFGQASFPCPVSLAKIQTRRVSFEVANFLVLDEKVRNFSYFLQLGA
jgi:hypothetical protein